MQVSIHRTQINGNGHGNENGYRNNGVNDRDNHDTQNSGWTEQNNVLNVNNNANLQKAIQRKHKVNKW